MCPVVGDVRRAFDRQHFDRARHFAREPFYIRRLGDVVGLAADNER